MKGTDQLKIRQSDGGAVISVKVVPGSTRDKIVGILGESLKIATSAPPEKGKANLAVAKILANELQVDTRSVQLAGGATNPHKEFAISGISADELREKLEKR